MRKLFIIVKISLPVLIIFSSIFHIYGASDEHVLFERAKTQFKSGIHYFNNMNYLAAVEFFRKALSIYPEYHLSREYLARSYKLSGFYEEAAVEWNLLFKSSMNVAVKNKVDTIRFRQVSSEFQNISDNYIYLSSVFSKDISRFRFQNPSDIITDSEKNIYVTSFKNGKIVKLSSAFNGEDVKEPYSGSRVFAVDYKDSKIVFSDFARDRIFVVDQNFKVLKEFGGSGSGNGKFHGPEGVFIDKKWYIYVVDSGNNRIQKFDNDGKFILNFGKKGEYEGELDNPSGVTVINDSVYVTDTGNKRIAVFDDSGNFIKNIKLKEMQKPVDITFDNNDLIISDEYSGVIFYNIKNKESRVIKKLNDKISLSRPIASTIDNEGYLYILDYNHEAIHLLSPITKQYSNIDVEIYSVDVSNYPSVLFYLNVRDRAGNPISGLKRNNFLVKEDNAVIRSASVDYFKYKKKSSSIVFCIDRSTNVEKWHNDIPWALDFILKQMRRNDRVQIVNFNRDSWVEQNFDWSRRRALKSLKNRKYSSGKNFGKALYNSISDLAAIETRRAIVMVTDGKVDFDSFSKYSVNNIINYAKTNYIPIYFISFENNNSDLMKISNMTGGAFIKASNLKEINKIYSKVKSQKEYRYVVSYSTLREVEYSDWWSNVNIEVKYKGQKGMEWGGYFVPRKR